MKIILSPQHQTISSDLANALVLKRSFVWKMVFFHTFSTDYRHFSVKPKLIISLFQTEIITFDLTGSKKKKEKKKKNGIFAE